MLASVAAAAAAAASSYAAWSLAKTVLGNTTSPLTSTTGGGPTDDTVDASTVNSDGITPTPSSDVDNSGKTPSVTFSPTVPSPLDAPHLNLYTYCWESLCSSS